MSAQEPVPRLAKELRFPAAFQPARARLASTSDVLLAIDRRGNCLAWVGVSGPALELNVGPPMRGAATPRVWNHSEHSFALYSASKVVVWSPITGQLSSWYGDAPIIDVADTKAGLWVLCQGGVAHLLDRELNSSRELRVNLPGADRIAYSDGRLFVGATDVGESKLRHIDLASGQGTEASVRGLLQVLAAIGTGCFVETGQLELSLFYADGRVAPCPDGAILGSSKEVVWLLRSGRGSWRVESVRYPEHGAAGVVAEVPREAGCPFAVTAAGNMVGVAAEHGLVLMRPEQPPATVLIPRAGRDCVFVGTRYLGVLCDDRVTLCAI